MMYPLVLDLAADAIHHQGGVLVRGGGIGGHAHNAAMANAVVGKP